MNDFDDKTGKPKPLAQFVAELKGKHNDVTARFVDWVVRAMANGTPAEDTEYEVAFAELFEHLLPGEGGAWVREIYRRAKAIRGQAA